MSFNTINFWLVEIKEFWLVSILIKACWLAENEEDSDWQKFGHANPIEKSQETLIILEVYTW